MFLAKANPVGNSADGPALGPEVREEDWLALTLEPPKAYLCPYCSKPFPSPQALGGHHNGHRKEKREEDRLFAEAKNALKAGMAVISAEPLRMVMPPLVPEIGPSFPTPPPLHYPVTVGVVEMPVGVPIPNRKRPRLLKLMEGMKRRWARGRKAVARRPRRNAQPKVLESQASSSGSTVDVVEELDLELRL